jgi:hypothetical protein
LGVKGLSPGAFKQADFDKDGTVDKLEFLKFYSFLKKTNRPSNAKKVNKF